MKTKKEAQQLAAAMTEVGNLMGVKVTHLLSPIDEPLGRTVGNAREVAECVEMLQGGGPPGVVITYQTRTVANRGLEVPLLWFSHEGNNWLRLFSGDRKEMKSDLLVACFNEHGAMLSRVTKDAAVDRLFVRVLPW
jgi:hypothetical protein